MSIRLKFFNFYLVTVVSLLLVGAYAVSIYRTAIQQEEVLIRESEEIIALAYDANAAFNDQMNSWKSILLRGNDVDNYHLHLKSFYQSERDARTSITVLKGNLDTLSRAEALTLDLLRAHGEMGQVLRQALRVFNETDQNPAQVTDRYTLNIEKVPAALLKQIIKELRFEQNRKLEEIQRFWQFNETVLVSILVATIMILIFVLAWLIDRNVGKPAEKAAYLANVLSSAQTVANFGTWDWDSENDEHYWSDHIYKILQVPLGSPPSLDKFIDCVVLNERESVQRALDEAFVNGTDVELETNVRCGEGAVRTVLLKAHIERTKATHVHMTSIMYDVTEQKQTESRLAFLANYDSLTGLPNRTLFHDRLEHAMVKADRHQRKVALLFLDLDHFKAVNDTLGHSTGDKLLVEVSDRIKRVIRESDTASRLGGDEFTIVLEDFEDDQHVTIVADHILKSLNEKYRINQNDIFISTSIGISFYPSDGRTVDTLLKNADIAMYRAKEFGRNGYHFYTEELNQRVYDRLKLENNLRSALAHDEFELYFQPQIELATGRVVSAEALLRWNNNYEMIGPNRFIPVLEETGMIMDAGQWVLDSALKMLQRLQSLGLSDMSISINLSPKQLRDDACIERILQSLDRSDVVNELLELELTESSLVETGNTRHNLRLLEETGVKLAIDDFGTGYSSLSYLRKLSVDRLKIDRSFIKDINVDGDDDAVTSAVIALSHRLGLEVTAEGVETEEQLSFLRKLDCHAVQGFLIAKPMAENEFLNWLKNHQEDSGGRCFWKKSA